MPFLLRVRTGGGMSWNFSLKPIAASVARSLNPRRPPGSTFKISATAAMSPAASRSARQIRTQAGSASRLSIRCAQCSAGRRG